MPHKFGINFPYHARWVPSVKRISQKAFFKHALLSNYTAKNADYAAYILYCRQICYNF